MLLQLTRTVLRDAGQGPRLHRGPWIGVVFCFFLFAVGNRCATEGLAQEATPSPVQPSQVEMMADELVEAAAATPLPEPAAGWDRRETLLASLTIFVLAVFLGFELITKVPPTLHTPLMSGSNAISGITLVGAILTVGVTSSGWMVPLLGTLAVVMATVNAVGGFAVTHRMLAMFRRK